MAFLRDILVDAPARDIPDADAFREQEGEGFRAVTWCQFKSDVYALGDALLDMGVYGNVCLLGRDCYAMVLAHVTITGGVGVAVTFDKNLAFSPISVKAQLKRLSSTTLMYTASHAVQALAAAELAGASVRAICIDTLLETIRRAPLNTYEYQRRRVDDDMVVAIFLTSGTTGGEKAVKLTQRNIDVGTYGSMQTVRENQNEIVLSVLPLNHVYSNISGIYGQIRYRATICFPENLRRLPDALNLFKPTLIFLVPQILASFHKLITIHSAEPLSFLGGSLYRIVCGGAPCPSRLISAFADWGVSIYEGYGITECSSVISANWEGAHKIGSVGRPLCVNEVRITDGEICVKGDNVFTGYYDQPEETRRALIDGWFHTGDIGELDDDGFLYVTGRIKNLIILDNGENVSPEELENLIEPLSLVEECVVSEMDGQIAAEIYINPAADSTEARNEVEEQLRAINQNLPVYKQITRARFRAEPFPKTASQKIIRNAYERSQ